jgi:hypothetical protein
MKILAAISFGLAVAVSGLLLVLPSYSVWSSESPSVRHATLLQVNGPRVLIALAIPVLIALVPVVLPKFWVRIAAALVLATFAILGGFSIGLFYAPSAVTMFLAGCLSAPVRKPRQTRHDH